jgi:tetratricopeptide (TPR) repeat protein
MFRTLFKSLKTGPRTSPAAVAAPALAVQVQQEISAASVRAGERAQLAQAQGSGAQAIAQARAQAAAGPGDLEALLTLAALLLADDPAQATGLYAQALALHPASGLLLNAYGYALQKQLRTAEAIAVLRRAVAVEPEANGHRFALSMLLFLAGAYREGFEHFRARNDPAGQLQKDPWLAVLPAWDGEPLQGRRLLVWTDWGGLGDELLFARYLTLVHRQYQPAQLHVRCTRQMRRLLANTEGVTAALDEGGVLTVDCHAPLLDLPYLLGTDLDSVPAPVPYLHPDTDDVARWAARLAGMRGLKIGLCWGSGFWSGGVQGDSARRNKTMSLELLAPLCDIDGVTLISLQKGGALAQLAALGLPVHDFDADLNDMADTAALASNLDLIITVDTSVSHLAGGLNRPTLVLLPYGSGSFWLMHTERSPWYPGTRLLRSSSEGDWAGVAARAVELVRGFAARGAVDVFAPET